LAYSYVYIKCGREKIVPEVVGFSIDEVIGKEVNDMNIKTCFLKNTSE